MNDEQRLYRVSLRGVTGCPDVSAETFYDANGFIDYELDFKGNKTDYTYNAAGQLLDMTTGINPAFPGNERLTKVEWNAAENQIKAVRRYGATISDPVTDIVFDYFAAPHAAARRPMSVSLYNRTPFGVPDQLRQFAMSYTFHPNKIVKTISVDGPRPGTADTTVITFNSSGDLISFRDALGNTVANSGHNLLGLPASVTDANGLVTNIVYNEIGQAIQATVKHPLGDRVTKIEYHALGMLSKIERPDGSIRFSEFDPRGLPIFTSAIGPGVFDVNGFTYGPDGSAAIEGGLGTVYGQYTGIGTLPGRYPYSREWEYDEIGRMTAEKRGFDVYRGQNRERTEQSYDGNGNVREIGEIGPANRVTTLVYNAHNELIEVSGPIAGESIAYGYDAGGRLNFVRDAKGNATTYEFDGFGNLIRQISPDTGATAFEYDEAGNLKKMTRNNGGVTVYDYDTLNRLKTVTAGTLVQSFDYDLCLNGKGRLCKLTDGSGSVAYTYTPTGKLASQTTVNGGMTYTTLWAYDLLDRMNTLTYPGGTQALYEYDAADYVSGVRVKIGAATQIVVQNVNHQPFGPVTYFDYGNGLGRATGHDLDYRTDYLTAFGADLQYEFSAFGEISSITNHSSTTLSQTFGYDALSRLATVNEGVGNQALKQVFVYDKNGNRDSHEWGGKLDNYYAYVGGNPISNIDPESLETYSCTRPLEGFRGFRAGPLYHQFLCTLDSKGVTCGGLGPSGGSSGMFGGSGIIEEEKKVTPDQCEKVRGPDTCFESCVQDALKAQPPNPHPSRAG